MLARSDLSSSPSIVPLFVYGTLRPGGALYDGWIKDAVVEAERATVYGYSLYAGDGAWYPHLVPDPSGYVIGDVLWIDRMHHHFARTWIMEVGAGYEPDLVEADTDTLVQPVPCVAFTWRHGTRGMRRVSADWFATSTERV